MPNILVIDDDDLVRQATKTILVAKGYDVVAVESGKAGIAAVNERRFDLAIVDLFMPGMDGLKAMEAIRQSAPTLPMIAASGFMFSGACPQMPNFDSMAKEAGAHSTLYKPFRPDVLVRAVEEALGDAALKSEAILPRRARNESTPVERAILTFRKPA